MRRNFLCREEVVCVCRACSSSILALYLYVGRDFFCRKCGSARLCLPLLFFFLLGMILRGVNVDGLSGILSSATDSLAILRGSGR